MKESRQCLWVVHCVSSHSQSNITVKWSSSLYWHVITVQRSDQKIYTNIIHHLFSKTPFTISIQYNTKMLQSSLRKLRWTLQRYWTETNLENNHLLFVYSRWHLMPITQLYVWEGEETASKQIHLCFFGVHLFYYSNQIFKLFHLRHPMASTGSTVISMTVNYAACR